MNLFNNTIINTSSTALLYNKTSGLGHSQAKALFRSIKQLRNDDVHAAHWRITPSHGKRSLAHNVLRYLYVSQKFLHYSTENTSNSNPSLTPTWAVTAPYPIGAELTADGRGVSYLNRNKRQTVDVYPEGMLPLPILNEHVAFYLHETGQMRAEYGTNKELMINRVIDRLLSAGSFLAEFNQVLLKNSGLFGAQLGETLSEDYQLRRVKEWITANMFGGSLDTFIAEKIVAGTMGESGETSRRCITNAMLKQTIDLHLAALLNLTETATNYILTEIVPYVIPTLGISNDSSPNESDYIGSLDWVYLHAGAHFAQEIKLGEEYLSKQALLSLGVSLEAMLLANTVSPTIIQFFIRPACIYFLVNKLIVGKSINDAQVMKDPAVRQDAVEQFFADSRLRNEQNNPFTQYSQAMERYRTRTQLAGDILRERCAAGTSGHYEVDAESYKNNQDGYSCKTDNGGTHPLITLLPNVSDVFRKQNQHIVERYRAVDTLLLAEAFAGLPTAETQFLAAHAIKLATAHFSAYGQYRGVLGAHNIPRSTYIIPLSSAVTLFSTTGAEERIYVLERRERGYSVTRIDRDPPQYYRLLDNMTPLRDKDYVLKIFAGGSQATILKPAGESLDGLISNLSMLAQDSLRTMLDNQGYDATTREKVFKVFLSLVPFYDCITGIIAGDRQAVAPCLFDVFSLLPLLGQAGSLVSRMAAKGAMGTYGAMRISLGSYAARQSLGNALSTGAGHFVKYAMAPAARELNQKAFIAMAVELARLTDPGLVEVFFRSGLSATRQLIAATKIIARHLPEIAPILPKINKLADAATETEKIVSFTTLRLADTNRYLSVAPLAGDRYRGKSIFVQRDPRTGNFHGRKYTLSDDNQLIPVPRSAAIHLQNILREGLGGKGGSRAVRVWNSQRSFDDIVSIELPQYPTPQYIQIESYGSREAETILFPELGIPLQQTPLDGAAYIKVFDALPNNQKLAIRVWTMIEGDKTRYHDGTRNLAQMGLSPMNDEINDHLFNIRPASNWDQGERMVFAGLLNAMESPLPRQTGSFLRVAEYKHGLAIPWADNIGPGDIVTNYPALMSVSSKDTYSRLDTEQAADEAEKNLLQALIYYKINGGANCLPLPYRITNTVATEHEYLYPPMSFFSVQSISQAAVFGGEMYPPRRIAVVLQELKHPVASAKNLFTGEVFNFELPGASGLDADTA